MEELPAEAEVEGEGGTDRNAFYCRVMSTAAAAAYHSVDGGRSLCLQRPRRHSHIPTTRFKQRRRRTRSCGSRERPPSSSWSSSCGPSDTTCCSCESRVCVSITDVASPLRQHLHFRPHLVATQQFSR